MTQRENVKLTDESDRATQIEMEFTEDSIEQARQRARPQQLPRADGRYDVTECIECGETIPLQRLRVAVRNLICIDCARDQENRVGRSTR